MISVSCPYCHNEHGIMPICKEESIVFKGLTVKYFASHFQCPECGELFDSKEMVDSNLQAIREAYEIQKNDVTPEMIERTRNRFNASQKAFGILLGMGELTINSYEQGKSAPSPTNRLLLRLAQNPFFFYGIYNINKDKIGEIQRKRIESSEAIKVMEKWQGLESLYHDLDSTERITIENKTFQVNSPVRAIVSDIIKSELNRDRLSVYSEEAKVKSCIQFLDERSQFASGDIA